MKTQIVVPAPVHMSRGANWTGAAGTAAQRKREISIAAPLLAAAVLLALVTSGYLIARATTGGRYFYPLDDAYIGMAVAKNISQYGVWGVCGNFASATSTPGFVSLLAACFWLTTPAALWPLALATAGSIAAIFAVNGLLRNTPPHLRVMGCLGVALLAPLHVMALLGMEHSLQIALVLLFVAQAIPGICRREPLRISLLLATATMVLVRYEGLFVAAGVCLLLLFQQRWRDLLSIAGAAWIPVIAFGLYFKLHGGRLLPNSLLLKGGPSLERFVMILVSRGLYFVPILFVVTWAAVRGCRTPLSPGNAALRITAVAAWLHLLLADFGWTYRYEAYLTALAIVSLLLLASEQPFKGTFGIAVSLAVCCLIVHAVRATTSLPGRSRVVYSQQYQTAELVSLVAAPAAVNDVGSPAYFSGVPIVDLTGLGNQEIMDARSRQEYNTDSMRRVLRSQRVQVIAVYEDWFQTRPKYPWGGPSLPPEYTRVAHLDAPAPLGYANENRVTYFAAPGAEKRVREAIQALRSSIPAWDKLTDD